MWTMAVICLIRIVKSTSIFSSLFILSFVLNPSSGLVPTLLLNEKVGEYKIKVTSPEHFQIFCYPGESKAVGNVWRTIQFKIICQKAEDCHLYAGHDENDVENAYSSTKESWSLYLLPSISSTDSIRLPLYNRSCVGVSATSSYIARVQIRRFDFWKLGQMTAGLILFFLAPNFSRNTFLHYVTGISLGVTGSFAIILFLICRKIPKKAVGITVFFGGATYVAKLLWVNFQTILHSYYNYVIAYIVLVGFISFIVCYRFPVENPRTFNLIQWATQISALMLIFLSSDNQEFSMAMVLLSLSVYNFPSKWSTAVATYWRRKFPPKPRLLTEEEYREQANLETQKALRELRSYCRSPNCDSWSVIGRLDSPKRFASFIEGNSHLMDEEMLEYETSDCYTALYTDDSE